MIIVLLFFGSTILWSQHFSKIQVFINNKQHILTVQQDLVYFNQTEKPLKNIVLNDWNNAYSNKKTPLAKRFSDEYVRSFYFSNISERSFTKINSFTENSQKVSYQYIVDHPDLLVFNVDNPILPNEKRIFQINYEIKIPHDKFTGYGFSETGKMNLKNWYLTPARIDDNLFVTNSNTNTDDIANAKSDYKLQITTSENCYIASDLDSENKGGTANKNFEFEGNNRNEFSLLVTPFNDFTSHTDSNLIVVSDLRTKLQTVEKAILIKKMVDFASKNLGKYPFKTIIVSQADYDKYPFYGLNQLPSFLRPFQDDFVFEIKFLKTYLNNVLKNTLSINQRKENWIKDGLQMYLIMKYIDEYYPNAKMMGSLAKYKLLKSYNLINLNFNQQFNYFYMLMARENLDQPIGDSKDSFIKYNEQIALKYKAGLSLKYLDEFTEKVVVEESIKEFYQYNLKKQSSEKDFQDILTRNSKTNIYWFFSNIIHSKKTIDYKFKNTFKIKDSIYISIKNKTKNNVPIPIYGLRKKQIIFKKWLSNIKQDTLIVIKNDGIDQLVLNYSSEVPEFHERNNYKKLNGFFTNNRPIKFAFMKDLEDSRYNQILYVPTLTYNLYDGLTPGISLHNKTLLEKPFVFNFEPSYATTAKSLTGAASVNISQNIYDSRLYRINYGIGTSYSHYAKNAGYSRISPGIYFSFRDFDLRSNRRQLLLMRYIFVNREKLDLQSTISNIKDQNYNVLNFKYTDTKSELAKHFSTKQDLQFSKEFGKFSTEFQYRKLFENTQQINIRAYAGAFLYNKTTSNYFNFALDRPTDYMFDYNYVGRSESTGLFSQQLIMAEGGFKSKISNPFSNQLLLTSNISFNIWNWVELYGDVGFLKNKSQTGKFAYDSGVRFNLVPDYFELFLPIHSTNGWEFDKNYAQKIRFVVTLSPQILTNLVKRRWF